MNVGRGISLLRGNPCTDSQFKSSIQFKSLNVFTFFCLFLRALAWFHNCGWAATRAETGSGRQEVEDRKSKTGSRRQEVGLRKVEEGPGASWDTSARGRKTFWWCGFITPLDTPGRRTNLRRSFWEINKQWDQRFQWRLFFNHLCSCFVSAPRRCE